MGILSVCLFLLKQSNVRLWLFLININEAFIYLFIIKNFCCYALTKIIKSFLLIHGQHFGEPHLLQRLQTLGRIEIPCVHYMITIVFFYYEALLNAAKNAPEKILHFGPFLILLQSPCCKDALIKNNV